MRSTLSPLKPHVCWDFYKSDKSVVHATERDFLSLNSLQWLTNINYIVTTTSSITDSAAAAKLLQSCLTLCDRIDGSPSGSSVPGIVQARVLEWGGIAFSNPWKWSRSVVSDSSQPHELQPSRPLHPWESPGKSTGVGCHCLLRNIH